MASLVKLDFEHRQIAERLLDRISSDEGALDEVVWALVAAEEVLAVKSSLRSNEQQRCQEVLSAVRNAING